MISIPQYRSEVVFVITSTIRETFFPQQALSGPVRFIRIYAKDSLFGNPYNLLPLSVKTDLPLVSFTFRDAASKELLVNMPGFAFSVDGRMKPERELADLAIDPKRCSVTMTTAKAVQFAIEFIQVKR